MVHALIEKAETRSQSKAPTERPTPPIASDAEQGDVYLRRTRLPAGLTEAEQFDALAHCRQRTDRWSWGTPD